MKVDKKWARLARHKQVATQVESLDDLLFDLCAIVGHLDGIAIQHS